VTYLCTNNILSPLGARYYNSDLSLWLSVDPKSDKYPSTSPYVYCGNNPVRLVDAEGEDVVYYDETGKEITRITSNTRYESYLRVKEGSAGSVNCELTPVSGSFAKVDISLSYTGNVNSSNKKMTEGQLVTYATENDGTVHTLSSFSANSGPSGVGSIPNGNYEAYKIENTSQKGMVRNGIGFKVHLTDAVDYCRNVLRIHPDGEEYLGTAGCIGLTDDAKELKSFRSMMQSFLKDGSRIPVNVNITGNPNYSDCDPNGKKKSTTKTFGN